MSYTVLPVVLHLGGIEELTLFINKSYFSSLVNATFAFQ